MRRKMRETKCAFCLVYSIVLACVKSIQAKLRLCTSTHYFLKVNMHTTNYEARAVSFARVILQSTSCLTSYSYYLNRWLIK